MPSLKQPIHFGLEHIQIILIGKQLAGRAFHSLAVRIRNEEDSSNGTLKQPEDIGADLVEDSGRGRIGQNQLPKKLKVMGRGHCLSIRILCSGR